MVQKSDAAYRTISEVAEGMGIATHVLRFWETKFPEIQPLRRGGGRRYYRPEDVQMLKTIQHLLHDEGYTIKGVRALVKKQGAKVLLSGELPVDKKAVTKEKSETSSASQTQKGVNASWVVSELQSIKELLDS